jgi:hypothetical protein
LALHWLGLGVEIGIALAYFALVLHWRWYLCLSWPWQYVDARLMQGKGSANGILKYQAYSAVEVGKTCLRSKKILEFIYTCDIY